MAAAPMASTFASYRGELQYEDRLHLRNRDYDPSTNTFLTPDPSASEPNQKADPPAPTCTPTLATTHSPTKTPSACVG